MLEFMKSTFELVQFGAASNCPMTAARSNSQQLLRIDYIKYNRRGICIVDGLFQTLDGSSLIIRAPIHVSLSLTPMGNCSSFCAPHLKRKTHKFGQSGSMVFELIINFRLNNIAFSRNMHCSICLCVCVCVCLRSFTVHTGNFH